MKHVTNCFPSSLLGFGWRMWSFYRLPPTPRCSSLGGARVQAAGIPAPTCFPSALSFHLPRSSFPTVSGGQNYTALRISLLSPPSLEAKQIQKLKHRFLSGKQKSCLYLCLAGMLKAECLPSMCPVCSLWAISFGQFNYGKLSYDPLLDLERLERRISL